MRNKEIAGFLLPTIKDMVLSGKQLACPLDGQEIHFLVEYLDYKVKAKNKK